MFKWSVQEGRSGGRQILHVRVSKGFASRPFYLGLGISKIVIFTWLECRREVPEGHPQTRSHLAQFDTVGFRAILA